MSEDIVYKGYKIRRGLYYTKTHEWLKVEEERGRVGITDYASKKLRDIVYVEEPEVGKEARQGEVLTTVESVKAVGEVYSPVTGKIVGWNEKLRDRPELVAEDPYGEGWMVLIEMRDKEELKGLLSAEDYVKLIEQEER